MVKTFRNNARFCQGKEKNFDLAEKAVKEIARSSKKDVIVSIPSSRKRDRVGDLLQTHDIVTNGLHDKFENDDPSVVTLLRTRIRRIKRKV